MYLYVVGIWILIRVLHDVSIVASCSWELGKGVVSASKYVVSKVKGNQKEEIEEDANVFTIIFPENNTNTVNTTVNDTINTHHIE
jgi:hypothetical protein